MTRREYIDRLVRLVAEISAVMDLMPHAAPLGDLEAAKLQGRVLSLKTDLDHAAGATAEEGYAAEFRAAAEETLRRLDSVRWNSTPDRKWYGAFYEARAVVERRLNAGTRKPQ